MENKKADNEFINYQKKINKIDDNLEIEKVKLQKLDEMQEELVALNRNMEACINLLASSMKGKSAGNIYKDLYYSNRKACRTIDAELEKSNHKTTKAINALYKSKYDLIQKQKKQMSEKDNKE